MHLILTCLVSENYCQMQGKVMQPLGEMSSVARQEILPLHFTLVKKNPLGVLEGSPGRDGRAATR